MKKVPITIFANFRIDTEERYIRLVDSLNSLKNLDIKEWIVNIRGSYRSHVVDILKQEIKEGLHIYDLNSKYGWFHDSRVMLEKISSPYVLFWIEDHIRQCSDHQFSKIVNELSANNIDYMEYSWWAREVLDGFNNIHLSESDSYYYCEYSKKENSTRQKNYLKSHEKMVYIISVTSIFSFKLFSKILKSNHPYLRRWPKNTPFDFEKRGDDLSFLPIKIAIPKFEIFAPIDDDNLYKGSSLISRNLYPNRISREDLLHIRDQQDFIKNTVGKYRLIRKIKNVFARLKYHI